MTRKKPLLVEVFKRKRRKSRKMGISTETRNEEEFMLAINNLCYLPTEVKNEMFNLARAWCNAGEMPKDVEEWIANTLGSMGYTECNMVHITNESGQKEWRYELQTPRTYKIIKT